MSAATKRFLTAVATLGVVATWGAAHPSASAATPHRTGPDRCLIDTVAVNPSGDHVWRSYDGTRVPTAWPPRIGMRDVLPDGTARLSSRVAVDPVDEQSFEIYGWVVVGDVLHHVVYGDNASGTLDPGDPRFTRVGGGWSTFREMEVAEYAHRDVATPRTTLYGLSADGVLHRWLRHGDSWRGHETFAGFHPVKSMTLISMTETYDTFLMNTRGGALYTVRVPLAAPMSPVVRVVRTRTWQGFETLVADTCGGNGTVLVGVDHDTASAYLYAVGHAIGTGTEIRGLGRLPGTFPDTVSAPAVPSPSFDVEPPPFGE